jgi:ABC-type multidrug transport system fused ATPase/permease subunit
MLATAFTNSVVTMLLATITDAAPSRRGTAVLSRWDVAGAGAYIGYQWLLRYRTDRRMGPVRRAVVEANARVMVQVYIGCASTPGAAARRDQAPVFVGGGGYGGSPEHRHGGAFTLGSKREPVLARLRPSERGVDPKAVPGCPTYVVVFLDAVPAGVTCTVAPADVVARADRHLAAARCVLQERTGDQDDDDDPTASAALLLRSSEFVFAGLDSSLVPLNGDVNCGRVICVAFEFADCFMKNLLDMQFDPAAQHAADVRGGKLPASLVRDLTSIASAQVRWTTQQRLHGLKWLADRLAVVSPAKDFAASLPNRMFTGFDADGFPAGSPRLDIESGRLVAASSSPPSLPLDAAQRTAIEVCEATATVVELSQHFAADARAIDFCVPRIPSPTDVATLRADPKMSALLLPPAMQRLVDHARSLHEGPASLRASGSAARTFLRIVRDVGAMPSLLAVVGAEGALCFMDAAAYFFDPRRASRSWGGHVQLAADQGLRRAGTSAAVHALLLRGARMISRRSLKVLAETVNVGVSARIVLSVVTADLSAVSSDDLEAVRNAAPRSTVRFTYHEEPGLIDTVRGVAISMASTMAAWSMLLSVAADAAQAPVPVTSIALLTYWSAARRHANQGSLVNTGFLAKGSYAADREVLEPATNLLYGGVPAAQIKGWCDEMRSVPRSGYTAALVLGSLINAQDGNCSKTRGRRAASLAALRAGQTNGATQFVGSMPWAVGQPGLALLISTAVARPPAASDVDDDRAMPAALAALAVVTRWPSSPLPFAQVVSLPALAGLGRAPTSPSTGRSAARFSDAVAEQIRLDIAATTNAAHAHAGASLNPHGDAAPNGDSEKENQQREASVDAKRAQLRSCGVVLRNGPRDLFGEVWGVLRSAGDDVAMVQLATQLQIEDESRRMSGNNSHITAVALVQEACVNTLDSTADSAELAVVHALATRRPATGRTPSNREAQRALTVRSRIRRFYTDAYQPMVGVAAGAVLHPLAAATCPFADAIEKIQTRLHLPHSIDRLQFRHREEVDARAGGGGSRERGAAVTFEHVCFAYPSSGSTGPSCPIVVLDDVSFHIPAGSFAAIVGESGAGKSTIVALLLRVYDCTSGRILIDGADVRSIPPRQLRRRLGLVGQACGLLPMRVDENLRVGAPDATLAGLWRALDRACLGSVVRGRPGQLLAAVAGQTLSGGERQRMVLARALTRLPASDASDATGSGGLLGFVLDEATSALDVLTERQVQRTLRDVGVTTIAVAHRLATVRDASVVVVLGAGGRVLETGSFSELAQQGEASALGRLVALQGLSVPSGAHEAVACLQRVVARSGASAPFAAAPRTCTARLAKAVAVLDANFLSSRPLLFSP